MAGLVPAISSGIEAAGKCHFRNLGVVGMAGTSPAMTAGGFVPYVNLSATWYNPRLSFLPQSIAACTKFATRSSRAECHGSGDTKLVR
jgi:hypothetical protein